MMAAGIGAGLLRVATVARTFMIPKSAAGAKDRIKRRVVTAVRKPETCTKTWGSKHRLDRWLG
jgi:hypothetical protein